MDYHHLKSINIQGFKSIKDQTIELNKLNVLIGQNGAGKSNFISLFKFLRNLIERKLKNTSLKAGAENLLYYGSKETKFILIHLDFSPNLYEVELQPAANESLFISLENCGFWKDGYDTPYWQTITTSEEESRLSKISRTETIANYVYEVLKEWRVYHFHDTSENAGVKKYCSLSDGRFLFEDASNLAGFLYTLKKTQEEYYERIVKTIQLVIPFFRDFILEPNPLNNELIRLEWVDNYSDKTFTAHELSDGSLRFICMATLLLQKKLPKILVLDEPELGLHPSAVTILAGLLKKASNRSQVVVSTQSVNLVDEFDADDIIVVEKKGPESIFKRLNSQNLESWLNDYSLGELWDKNIIGGKP